MCIVQAKSVFLQSFIHPSLIIIYWVI
jgi:hypothetical protein